MLPIDIIDQLALAPSRGRKEQIIMDAYSHDCVDFFHGAQMAHDALVNFSVRRVPEIIEDDGAVGSFGFQDFLRLCHGLRTLALHGDTAREALKHAANACHAKTWNEFYRPILLKNLHVVDPVLTNRVIHRLGAAAEKYALPIFRCAMPTVATELPSTGSYLIEADMAEGRRTIVCVDASAWGLTPPHGQRCELPDAITAALGRLASQLPAGVVLDGAVSPDNRFTVSDMVPLEHFRARTSSKIQRERRQTLEALITAGVFEGSMIRLMPAVEVAFGTEEGNRLFSEYAQHAAGRGCPTISLRRADAAYHAKQSRNWFRVQAERFS